MSQRGGSVVTYVRFGDKVYSPVIDRGEADFIVSFEQLEAARWLPYLKEGGRVIVSTQEIDPMPVITGAAQYPENLVEKMKAAGAKVDASVVKNGKGKKVIVFKYKPKKGYRRKQGHRQPYTKVTIGKISV